MIIHKKALTLLASIPSIKRKTWVKILGVTLQQRTDRWNRHFETLLKKASGRMYFMQVCKYYGFPTKLLALLI